MRVAASFRRPHTSFRRRSVHCSLKPAGHPFQMRLFVTSKCVKNIQYLKIRISLWFRDMLKNVG